MPDGDSNQLPEWVRKDFIGLEFTVVPCRNPEPYEITTGNKQETHYAVGAIGAIKVLEQNSKQKTAEWLKSKCDINKSTTFLFERSVCEIVAQ